MGHFEENLLSKLPNTWLSSNMQDEVSKMLLKLWTLISEDLSVLCQMGQNTASLLVSLSRSWCCHPTRKENDDKNQKKAQDNLSSVFTLRRFRSLRETLIAAEVEEEDYLRGEKVKIKEKIICVYVCMYICIHTYIENYNLWMKWSLFYILIWGTPTSETLPEQMTMFPAARKQLPPQLCPQLKLKACSTSFSILCEGYFTHWEAAAVSKRRGNSLVAAEQGEK